MTRRTISAAVAAAANADFTAAIAERAYFRALNRGFAPGHELDDWLAAEREVAASFARTEPPPAGRAAAARKRKPAR
ncbi:MAG TPA: DUF2934 domain-containing protein [Gammaproteobacteria bacterium]|nr:DUF2934 domain-containing protein [Gammaproteobacteria bacterium]